jgi:hypothetical protein
VSDGLRKPLGALLIIAFIAVWALLIAHFAASIGRWPVLVQASFYIAAGLGWVVPLRPALRWIETGRWRAAPRSASSAADQTGGGQ